MGDTVVVTDDDHESSDSDIATETVIDHAEDIGMLKAGHKQVCERLDGLEGVVGGLAVTVDGLGDMVETAVRTAFDAMNTAAEASMKADEIVEDVTEAVEDAAEDIAEDHDETPPPPPDEPPESKRHPWWRR